MKLGISPLFRIRQDGVTLRFYPSSMSRVLWVEQFVREDRRHEDRELFKRYLRPGDVVIDAGANIGLLTLIASGLVGVEGRVYAFEPHPRIYGYLQGNIALNGVQNVHTFNVALGDTPGVLQFDAHVKGDDRSHVVASGPGIAVVSQRLDEVEMPDGPIALVKIDVEGYEKFVIEGASRLLDRVDCVYFEVIEENSLRFGYSPGECLAALASQGFHILALSAKGVTLLSALGPATKPADLLAVRDVGAFMKRMGLPHGDGNVGWE